MKTKVKSWNKVRGAYASAAVRNLKSSGLTGETLRIAIDAVTGQKKTAIIKLPRKVSKSITQMLSKYKRVVVVNKTLKRFKVYSFEGYISMKAATSKNATANKLWEYSSKAKKTTSEIVEDAINNKSTEITS